MAAAKKAPENKLVSVKFIKPWGRYCKGDLAGFEPSQAEKLINGIKVAVKPGDEPKAEAED